MGSGAAGCGGGGAGNTDAGVDASSSGDAGRQDASATDVGAADTGGADGGASDLGHDDAGGEDGGALTDGGAQADGGGGTDAGGVTDAGYDAGDPDLGMPGEVTTYLLRIDERDCLPPGCGGFFVQAVNQEKTLCADGLLSAECYVAELDWAPSGLRMADQTRAVSASGGFLVDARMERRRFGNAGVLGVLAVEGAWIAEWGARIEPPSLLPFHALARTPLLCLIDPCFNIRVDTLNTADGENVSGLSLSMVGASAADVLRGQAALEAGTLRATGAITTDTVPGPGGLGETYHATQFYVPLPFESR